MFKRQAFKPQEAMTVNRSKSFRICGVCLEWVHIKGVRAHQETHTKEEEWQQGMDPTHVRIESLRNLISAMEAKARLTKGEQAVLSEYQSGIVVLRKKLIMEKAAAHAGK